MKTNIGELFLVSVFVCLYGISSGISIAGGNPEAGVFAPPGPLVIDGPPAMAVISGTPYVYFAPGVSVGLFFCAGHWYRPHEGHWFRARSYRGPWAYVGSGFVPPVLVKLPPNYRKLPPPGHRKIPYGHMKDNWKSWERERHWDGPTSGRSVHNTRHGKNERRTGNGNHKGHGGGLKR